MRELAGLDDPAIDDAAFLVVEGEDIGEGYPLSGETLAPVLTVYRVADFDHAIEATQAILEYEGIGHSCTLHTTVEERADHVGREIDVGRIAINQPSLALAGGFDNALDFTLSLGGGTWAGNQFDSNLDYTHFLNTTTVARPADVPNPDVDTLFGEYPAGDETTVEDLLESE